MPDLNGDGIITIDEIFPSIQIYYSKDNMEVIVKTITDMITENQRLTNEKIDTIMELISSGDIEVPFEKFVTKDELAGKLSDTKLDIQEIINNLTVDTEIIPLEVTEDDQKTFHISTTPFKGSMIMFNSTIRTEYTATNEEVNINFKVLKGSVLNLIVFRIK